MERRFWRLKKNETLRGYFLVAGDKSRAVFLEAPAGQRFAKQDEFSQRNMTTEASTQLSLT
jgi:hypothetical protein